MLPKNNLNLKLYLFENDLLLYTIYLILHVFTESNQTVYMSTMKHWALSLANTKGFFLNLAHIYHIKIVFRYL